MPISLQKFTKSPTIQTSNQIKQLDSKNGEIIPSDMNSQVESAPIVHSADQANVQNSMPAQQKISESQIAPLIQELPKDNNQNPNQNPNQTFLLTQKISELESALKARHPSMPSLLKEIWRTLRQYPEQVTILPDDQLAIIVQGIETQTNIHLSTPNGSAAKVKAVKSRIKSLGLDAF